MSDAPAPEAALAAALVKFQAVVENPKNTKTNPHFKNRYAPLDVLLNDVRPLLAKHGLALVQKVKTTERGIGVVSVIVHRGGEQMECGDCILPLPKNDPQGAGSALTYARRYSLSAALGIASEDDDDGNLGSREDSEPEPSQAYARTMARLKGASPKDSKQWHTALAFAKAQKATMAAAEADAVRAYIGEKEKKDAPVQP